MESRKDKDEEVIQDQQNTNSLSNPKGNDIVLPQYTQR